MTASGGKRTASSGRGPQPARPVETADGRLRTVVFDGDCLFCQRWVRFIHARDPANLFRFAARQTPAGHRLLQEAGVAVAPNSIVLLDAQGTWLHSDAVLRIAVGLGMPWARAGLFLRVPRVLRDGAYRVVARVRHRLARHLPACERPDAALRAKMLE